MLEAVDLLASEYSWSKKQILNTVYIDELLSLSEIIRRRKAEEYTMHLAIVSNPHIAKTADRKILWEALKAQSKETNKDQQLDRAGFQRFKEVIMSNSKNIRVK